MKTCLMSNFVFKTRAHFEPNIKAHFEPNIYFCEKFSLFQDSSSCCIQISRHLFLLFEGFRVPNFAQRWIVGWRINYTGLALQDGQRNVTRSSFCLLGKAAIFPFLQVGCDWDKIRHAMTQNMKNRKTIVWISKPWHKDPNWQQNLLVKIHFSIW